MPNINNLLRDHVTLEAECLDRIYLNGYIPNLQIPGQLIAFLVQHRKQKIPSPALLNQMTQNFVKNVKQYAEENDIPIIHFEHGQRKDDIAARMRRKNPVKDGVVFIGVAQEKAYAFKGRKKNQKGREGGFLSGGEQQMLAIGRAMMAQPKLLLLDEPLLGLSPMMEEVLTEAVRDINKEIGISVLISEQYARPILPIIGYGYVLENGGAVVEGSYQELMDNPDVKSAYFGL